MMSDHRRRSPESSRRRRRLRRDSREQSIVEDTASSATMRGPQESTMSSVPYYPSQSKSYSASSSFQQQSGPPEDYQVIPPIFMRSSENTHRAPSMSMPAPMSVPVPVPADLNRPRRQRRRRGSGSSSEFTFSTSASSSSSSSYLDISRWYPSFGRSGGVLKAFFKTPSEHRPRRRRSGRMPVRSKKAKSGAFVFGNNSSSSSVNSDMAYGMGFIKKPRNRSRGFSPNVAAAAAASSSSTRRAPPPLQRRQTDEEIMEIGRKLAEVAKKQSREDSRHGGGRHAAQLGVATSSWDKSRRQSSTVPESSSRGLGSSRHRHRRLASSSGDDSEWESASEDEDSDEASALAYGHSEFHATSSASRISTESKILGAKSPEDSRHTDRNSSVVDPQLFGPHNSLREFINTPCGFNDGTRAYTIPETEDQRFVGSAQSASYEARPMQRVFPLQTSDPGKIEAARTSGSVVSSQPNYSTVPLRSVYYTASAADRPDPVPIQAPKPIAPVPSSMYDEERIRDSEPSEHREPRRNPSDSKIFTETALVGAGVAALGAAMLARRNRGKEPEHNLSRDEKYGHDDHREDETKVLDARKAKELALEKEIERLERALAGTNKAREVRRHESKRLSDPRLDERSERNKTEVDADKDKDQSEESDRDYERERERRRQERSSRRSEPAGRDSEYAIGDGSDSARSFRRPSSSKVSEPSQRPAVVEKDAQHRSVQDPTNIPSKGPPIDVFQYQDPDDASRSGDTLVRAPSPMIIDVSPAPSPTPEQARKSRRESFEDERREARHIYEEATHSTAPIDAVDMAAAIAATEHSRRQHEKEWRSRSRSRSGSRTPEDIQEEADRTYRAERVARSRSSGSHERSVVDKYEDTDDTKPRIVTPPGMSKPTKSRYSEPNADIMFDNMMSPTELRMYWPTEAPVLDPSAQRPRPVLNLVMPTPVPTPSPEKQLEKSASQDSAPAEEQPKREASNVVLGPRGEAVEVFEATEPPQTPKSVSWGPSETKQYEVESREASLERPTHAYEKPSSSGKKSGGGGWGTIAAAITGASVGAALARDDKSERSWRDDSARDFVEERRSTGSRSPPKERPILPAGISSHIPEEEPEELPPVPGPKPASPRYSQIPGAFGEDLDFTATLAAGLEHSGFDPEIVIEDPEYRRRDSPPGSNEPFTGLYMQPFAETATDLGIYDIDDGSGPVHTPGYVIGEVADTPSSERAAVLEQVAKDAERPEREAPKLSKKEQRKLEKAAKAVKLAEQKEQAVQPVEADEDEWGYAPSSKKSNKSKRLSVSRDDVQTPVTESHVSTPANAFDDIKDTTGADDLDMFKTSKKPKRNSKGYDVPEEEPLDERDNRRDSYEPIGRSVLSDSMYDDRSNGHSHEDGRSVISVPPPESDNKRGSKSENQKRSSGGFWGILKGSSNGEDTKDSKKDNAGTLGAGAGLAGAAMIIAALANSDAVETSPGQEEPHIAKGLDVPSKSANSPSREVDVLEDPEIAPRVIKPAIDPQYGDLLPLPPSPSEKSLLKFVEDEENLPSLPDSRPATPPGQERAQSQKRPTYTPHTRRSSTYEAPLRSPSHTAIPIQFRMSHHRSSPAAASRSSPVVGVRSPPTVHSSPDSSAQESSPTFKRQPPSRPTSWDSSREFKPLYLLEQAGRTGLGADEEYHDEMAESTPLPPSRESPAPASDVEGDELVASGVEDAPLFVDTNLAQSAALGSQDLTPLPPSREPPTAPEAEAEPVEAVEPGVKTTPLFVDTDIAWSAPLGSQESTPRFPKQSEQEFQSPPTDVGATFHEIPSASSLSESNYATPAGSPSREILPSSELASTELESEEGRRTSSPRLEPEPEPAQVMSQEMSGEQKKSYFPSALSMLPAAALAGVGVLLNRGKADEPNTGGRGSERDIQEPLTRSADQTDETSVSPRDEPSEVELSSPNQSVDLDDSRLPATESQDILTAEDSLALPSAHEAEVVPGRTSPVVEAEFNDTSVSVAVDADDWPQPSSPKKKKNKGKNKHNKSVFDVPQLLVPAEANVLNSSNMQQDAGIQDDTALGDPGKPLASVEAAEVPIEAQQPFEGDFETPLLMPLPIDIVDTPGEGHLDRADALDLDQPEVAHDSALDQQGTTDETSPLQIETASENLPEQTALVEEPAAIIPEIVQDVSRDFPEAAGDTSDTAAAAAAAKDTHPESADVLAEPSSQPAQPIIDDEWAPASSKKGKKDKKKRKQQSISLPNDVVEKSVHDSFDDKAILAAQASSPAQDPMNVAELPRGLVPVQSAEDPGFREPLEVASQPLGTESAADDLQGLSHVDAASLTEEPATMPPTSVELGDLPKDAPTQESPIAPAELIDESDLIATQPLAEEPFSNLSQEPELPSQEAAEPTPAVAEEEFPIISKKSKKSKKKRKGSAVIDQGTQVLETEKFEEPEQVERPSDLPRQSAMTTEDLEPETLPSKSQDVVLASGDAHPLESSDVERRSASPAKEPTGPLDLSSAQPEALMQEDIPREEIPSREDVLIQEEVPSKEKVISQEEVPSQEDIPSQEDVASQEPSTQEDVPSQEIPSEITSREQVSIEEETPAQKDVPSQETPPKEDILIQEESSSLEEVQPEAWPLQVTEIDDVLPHGPEIAGSEGLQQELDFPESETEQAGLEPHDASETISTFSDPAIPPAQEEFALQLPTSVPDQSSTQPEEGSHAVLGQEEAKRREAKAAQIQEEDNEIARIQLKRKPSKKDKQRLKDLKARAEKRAEEAEAITTSGPAHTAGPGSLESEELVQPSTTLESKGDELSSGAAEEPVLVDRGESSTFVESQRPETEPQILKLTSGANPDIDTLARVDDSMPGGLQLLSQELEGQEDTARREAEAATIQDEETELARLKIKRKPSKKDKERIKTLKANAGRRDQGAEAAAQRKMEEQSADIPHDHGDALLQPDASQKLVQSSVEDTDQPALENADSGGAEGSKQQPIDVSTEPYSEAYAVTGMESTAQLPIKEPILGQSDVSTVQGVDTPRSLEDVATQLPQQLDPQDHESLTQDQPETQSAVESPGTSQGVMETTILPSDQSGKDHEETALNTVQDDIDQKNISQHVETSHPFVEYQSSQLHDDVLPSAMVDSSSSPVQDPISLPEGVVQDQEKDFATGTTSLEPRQSPTVEAQPEPEWSAPSKKSRKDKKKKRKGTNSSESGQNSGFATPLERGELVVAAESEQLGETLPSTPQEETLPVTNRGDSSLQEPLEVALLEENNSTIEPPAVEPSTVEPTEMEHITSSVSGESYIGTQESIVDRGLEDHVQTSALDVAKDITASASQHHEPEHGIETTDAPFLSQDQSTSVAPPVVEFNQTTFGSEQVTSEHGSTDAALNADSDSHPSFPAHESRQVGDTTQDAVLEKQEAVKDVERDEDLALEKEPSIPAVDLEPQPKDEDFSWTPSKKSKKDKKKKRSGTSWTEPSSDAQTPITANVAETGGSRDEPEPSTTEEAEALTQSLAQDEAPAQSSDPEQQIDDWSNGSSRKGKKGKKKNRSSISSWEPQSSTQAPLIDEPTASPDVVKDLFEESESAGASLASQTAKLSTQEAASLPEPDSSVKQDGVLPLSMETVPEQMLKDDSLEDLISQSNLDNLSNDVDTTLIVAGRNVEDDNRDLAGEHVTFAETDPQQALTDAGHHLDDRVTQPGLDSRVTDGEDTPNITHGHAVDENVSLLSEQTAEDLPRRANLQSSDLEDTLPEEPAAKLDLESRVKDGDDTLTVAVGQVADEISEPWAFQAAHSNEAARKLDLQEQASDGDDTHIVAGGGVSEQSRQPSLAEDDGENIAEPVSGFLDVERSAVRPQSPVPWEDEGRFDSPQQETDFLSVDQPSDRPASSVPWEDNNMAEDFISPGEQRPDPILEPQSALTSSPCQITEEAFKAVPGESESQAEEFDDWAPKKLSKKEKRKAKKNSISIPELEPITTSAEDKSTLPSGSLAPPETQEQASFDRDDNFHQAERTLSEAAFPGTTNDVDEPPDKPDSDQSLNDLRGPPTEIPEHSSKQLVDEPARQARSEKNGASIDDSRDPEPSLTETATVKETPLLSRKQSKKEKRKAKKKGTSLWEDEVLDTGQAADENPSPGIPTPVEEPEMSQEKAGDTPPSQSPPVDDISGGMETTAMNESVAEDEWSVPLSRKKSKKDKKKGKLSEPTSGAQAPLREEPLASIGTEFAESRSHNLEYEQPIEKSTENASDSTSLVWALSAEHLQIPGAAQIVEKAAANEGTELQKIPAVKPSPDIWDNEDYFRPRSPRDPGVDATEEPFNKVEIHPAFASDLNTSPDKNTKDDRPLVGLGLIRRHSSIFQEDERHTPKLLTMTSDNFSLDSVAVEDSGLLEGSSQSGALSVTETASGARSNNIPHDPIFDAVDMISAQPANAASARDITAPNLGGLRPISPSPSRTSFDGSREASTPDGAKQMTRTGSVALLAERFGGTKKGSGKTASREYLRSDIECGRLYRLRALILLKHSTDVHTGLINSPSTTHGSETRFDDDNVSVTHSPTSQNAGSFTRQVPEYAVREEEVPLESLVLESPILGSQSSFEMTTDETRAASHSPKSPLDVETSRTANRPPALNEPRPQLHYLLTTSSASPTSKRGVSLEESALPSIETSDDTPRSDFMPALDFGRPVSRGLPPVQEEPQEEEAESGKHATTFTLTTPDINRDSGFVADSPIPPWMRRLDDAQQRDSGVHLRDYPDTSPRLHGSQGVSPEPSRHSRSSLEDEGARIDDKLRRSPMAGSEARRRLRDETPVLEAQESPVTPEPQKSKTGRSRSHKTYPDLGPGVMAAAAGLAGGGALLAGARAGAASRSPSPSSSPDASKRSISDNTAEKRRASASPQDSPPSRRRAISNTGISRARTPEPLHLRPDSPSLLRHSATPPLRSRRTRSGDLRSLSQSSQPSQSDLGAKGSPQCPSPAPVSRDAAAASPGPAPAPAPAPAPNTAPAANTPAPASSSSSTSDLKKRAATTSASAAQPSKSPVANEGRVRTKDMADVYVSRQSVSTLMTCQSVN